jgi:hypothetical protein
MLTRFHLEEVYNHVAEIDQQPKGILSPFGPERSMISGLHLKRQFVGEGQDLAAGVSGGDHEDFCDLNEVRDIEQRDVFGLLIVEDVGNLTGGAVAIGFDCDGGHP